MIDLSDLCDDPDFGQPLSIVRRLEMVGYDGVTRSQSAPITPAPYGSIQSGANPTLLRTSDMATVGKIITVYTKFRLREEGSAAGYATNADGSYQRDAYGNPIPGPGGLTVTQADVVYYLGDPYQVLQVQDWTGFGAGFVEAICSQVNMGQAAP